MAGCELPGVVKEVLKQGTHETGVGHGVQLFVDYEANLPRAITGFELPRQALGDLSQVQRLRLEL